MSLVFLFLKAARIVDYPFDYAIFFILADLDLLVLMRLVWLIRRWN